MSPAEFLRKLQRDELEPAYLFVGAEPYRKRECRRALSRKILGEDGSQGEFLRCDLAEQSLVSLLDDARSLSLFSPRRLIWAESAEAVVSGRRKTSVSTEAGREQLLAYLRSAPAGVVIVFEASRYELDFEGRKKYEPVLAFYQPVAQRGLVEFPPFTPEEATNLAAKLAQRAGLKLGPSELALLVELTAADPMRIASEIEKLQLRAEPGQPVTAELISELVPNAPAATIFDLVRALGQRERRRALEDLYTVAGAGEALTLVLTFLEAQFRQALLVQELGLRGPQQVLAYFQKLGVRIWPKRAQEIWDTARLFQPGELARAIEAIYEVDKGLREACPSEHILVERLAVELTRPGEPAGARASS